MAAWTLATGVPTHCFPNPFPWAAMAVWDTQARAIYLSAETCTYLQRLRAPGDPWDAALGLIVYGHELAHARGITSHARADCQGKTKVGILARRLGASFKRSQRIKRAAADFTFQCGDPMSARGS